MYRILFGNNTNLTFSSLVTNVLSYFFLQIFIIFKKCINVFVLSFSFLLFLSVSLFYNMFMFVLLRVNFLTLLLRHEKKVRKMNDKLYLDNSNYLSSLCYNFHKFNGVKSKRLNLITRVFFFFHISIKVMIKYTSNILQQLLYI